MEERFDVENILRDMLEVLRRHHLPVESAALNISLLDAAFDEYIPQLKTYNAGHFHRPMVIDNVPVLFHAQRRHPFDGIVQALEREIRPPIEAFVTALQGEYPGLKIEFVRTLATQLRDWPHSLYLHSYRLGIDCRFSDDAHVDYNQLVLSVWLQQREATTYPHLYANVGWLVDEESGGDWGIDIVYDAIAMGQDYTPHDLKSLQKALPSCFMSFRKEIARTLSGEAPNSR